MRTAFSIVYIVIFVKFTKWIKKLRLKSYMLYLKSVRILKSSLLNTVNYSKNYRTNIIITRVATMAKFFRIWLKKNSKEIWSIEFFE